MKRTILRGALLLCVTTALLPQFAAAQNTPAPAPAGAPPEEAPERLEEKAYVRKFSLGVSLNFTPFNLLPKQTLGEKVTTGPTPIEFNSSVDPKSNRTGIGFTAQYAFASKWAVAIAPVYRKVAFHAFIERFEGTDNSSTFLDERAKFQINEDTTARYLDLPILLRHYNKARTESGPRWFFEVGPVMRRTSQVRMSRDTVPPKGDRFQDNIPLPYKSNTLGVTAGIGGQFIDDFGIRAIPEVRFTRWLSRPFESVHGNTRVNQVEIVLTFAF